MKTKIKLSMSVLGVLVALIVMAARPPAEAMGASVGGGASGGVGGKEVGGGIAEARWVKGCDLVRMHDRRFVGVRGFEGVFQVTAMRGDGDEVEYAVFGKWRPRHHRWNGPPVTAAASG